MVTKTGADAFVSNTLRNNVNYLKTLTNSIMTQIHSSQALKKNSISDDEFQDKVITELYRTLDSESLYQFDYDLHFWSQSKEATMKSYFNERLKNDSGTNPERFLKVGVKCNSLGGLDKVLFEDIEPWLDSLREELTNPQGKNYLKKTATKKQTLQNLKNMLAFPVIVKETKIKEHLPETAIDGLILNHPETYLPSGAIKALEQGAELKNILIVTSNVITYNKNKVKHRIEGRLKATEAMKWAKYITGIRQEPLYDGIGLMEIGTNIQKLSEEVLTLKETKTPHHIDYRFPSTLSEKPTKEELKLNKQISEDAIMNLLQKTYLKKDKTVSKNVPNYTKELIYGSWIDMTFQTKKTPIEIQVKDSLSNLLYGFNSPMGHNSKIYNNKRKNELHKTINIAGTNYSVDKITEYIANTILMPAFTNTPRTS